MISSARKQLNKKERFNKKSSISNENHPPRKCEKKLENVQIAVLREGDLQHKGRPKVENLHEEGRIDHVEEVLVVGKTELDIATGQAVVQRSGDVKG